MKHVSILALAVLLFSGASLGAQPTEEWVARYNGPGNSNDWAQPLALDGSGNVYVTGLSLGSGTSADYATIKYDSDGNTQWVARYNGPGNGLDGAQSIAVDGSGNVYLTGYSLGLASIEDYATIKYDSDGNEQWVARYNGPGNSSDAAFSIAVDGSGNVYVTGLSWSLGSGDDYATIKYDPDSVQQWVARYNGPGNGSDAAHSIAVDGAGNVYATGRSLGLGTSEDYATIKYDSDGNEEWVARYDGPGNGADVASCIAVDGSGNVYVTGQSAGSGTSADYATIKYDSDGNEEWVARYNGPGNGSDVAYPIAVDGSGNVYVTGHSVGSASSEDYATIKYDSDGNELWVARYNGPENGWDGALSIAVDGSGNVYVTGQSMGSGSSDDYATIKYDSEGNEQWVVRYNGPGNGSDVASCLALDGSNNVYVTGYSWGSGTEYDYATIKYSQVFQPDNLVKNSDESSYIGNDIYNTDGENQTKSQTVEPESTAIYHVRIENDGNVPDEFTVAGDESGLGWDVRYFDALSGGAEITDDVTGSGWSTGELAPDDYTEIRVEVTSPASAPNGTSYDVLVTSASVNADTKQDAVKATTTVQTGGLEELVPLIYSLVVNSTGSDAMVITYSLPWTDEVSLVVYDVSGCAVKTLISDRVEAGVHELIWDTRRIPRGVYFCRMQADSFESTEKLVVIR